MAEKTTGTKAKPERETASGPLLGKVIYPIAKARGLTLRREALGSAKG